MRIWPAILLLLSVMAVAQFNTYSTSFPLTENPISEGVKWQVPGAGSHWGNVQTVSGGYVTGAGAQTTVYGDYTGLLTGTWGPDQTVQATVRVPTASTIGHEVELRLRSSLAGSSNTGYEAYCTVASNDAYCHIARWRGWGGSSTNYCNIEDSTTPTRLLDGDVIKATVTGTSTTVITLYRQTGGVGVFTQIAQATTTAATTYPPAAGTDCGAVAPFTSGNPGLGFWDGSTNTPQTYMGFSSYMATDGTQTASWTGILSPARAINWTGAGLPSVLPDGETTPNPWTPPTRTNKCGDVTGTNTSADLANIQTAANSASCIAGSYVALHGNFLITNWLRLGYTSTKNNITLRGDGPMNTTLTMNGDYGIEVGAGSAGGGAGRLTSNPLRGATLVTLNNVTSTGLTTANINAGIVVARFIQCDSQYTPAISGPLSGTTATDCTTTQSGAGFETGGILHCAGSTYCDSNGNESVNHQMESQTVRVTSAKNNGNGTWTLTFSPGIHMPDWDTGRGATLRWYDTTYSTTGIGIENLTILAGGQSGNPVNAPITIGRGTASWLTGVRIIGHNNNWQIVANFCSHCLIAHNYFFGESPTSFTNPAMSGSFSNILRDEYSGDTLVLNNISQLAEFNDNGHSHTGYVVAYNYSRDIFTGHYQSTQFEHEQGSNFALREGNQFGSINDDNTHSSHNFQTTFRNNLDCGDYPYQIPGQAGHGIQVDAFSRFENAIGNAMGISVPVAYRATYLPNKCSAYQGQADAGFAWPINGGGDGVGIEPGGLSGLTASSLFRWGNVSTIQQSSDTPSNSGIRFVAAENPVAANLSSWPNAQPYANLATPSTSLPCSMFLPNFSGQTCTPIYTGNVGIGWWKVCNQWTAFPTVCAHTVEPPFPAAGPDILGSSFGFADYANDIPATIAWKTLPIDTSYQNTYPITGSSWSGGVETFTVSLPSGTHIMGGFQFSGTCANFSPFGELQMSSSTSTSISFNLTANPGTCSGNVLWPDVRQFDQRVYVTSSSAAQTGAATVAVHAIANATGIRTAGPPQNFTRPVTAVLNVTPNVVSNKSATLASTIKVCAANVPSGGFNEPPVVYTARTDHCVDGSQADCVPGATTGKAGAPMSYLGYDTDALPFAQLAAGATANTCFTDPDFGTYECFATDQTSKGASTNFSLGSGGDNRFTTDETMFTITTSGSLDLLVDMVPARFKAHTCAPSPSNRKCFVMSQIASGTLNGNAAHDATIFDTQGVISVSRTEPSTFYERTDKKLNRLVVTQDKNAEGTPTGLDTLTRTLVVDFTSDTPVPCKILPPDYNGSWNSGGAFIRASGGGGSYQTRDWDTGGTGLVTTDTFIRPVNNNVGANWMFQATTPGQTSGTEPIWNTSCATKGSTCTDGAVIWTNIGNITGQGPGFDVIGYDPAPGHGCFRANTRTGRIFRGTGSTDPAGDMTTDDWLTCDRQSNVAVAGTGSRPCRMKDTFGLHAGGSSGSQYATIGPTGAGADNPQFPGVGSCVASGLRLIPANGSGKWTAGTSYTFHDLVFGSDANWYDKKTSGTSTSTGDPSTLAGSRDTTNWENANAVCYGYIWDRYTTMVRPLFGLTPPLGVSGGGFSTDGHNIGGWIATYRGGKMFKHSYGRPTCDDATAPCLYEGAANPGDQMDATSSCNDSHPSFNNAGLLDKPPAFFPHADVPAWPTNYVCSSYNEITALAMDQSQIVWRFGHNWSTGSNLGFGTAYAIGTVSSTGNLFAYGGDFMNSRGDRLTGNSTCEHKLRGMYPPVANMTVHYLDTMLVSGSRDAVYQVTTCGTSTPGASCQMGALPNWSNCTATCTSGGATLTNLGPNTCRGDIVVIDTLSAHPAP